MKARISKKELERIWAQVFEYGTKSFTRKSFEVEVDPIEEEVEGAEDTYFEYEGKRFPSYIPEPPQKIEMETTQDEYGGFMRTPKKSQKIEEIGYMGYENMLVTKINEIIRHLNRD